MRQDKRGVERQYLSLYKLPKYSQSNSNGCGYQIGGGVSDIVEEESTTESGVPVRRREFTIYYRQWKLY